nr:integrase, catalytic region, zinc finger, CCHC-type, peptidase aspartic, catalytic [Tanacetum cinerariifolium]
MNMGQDRQIQNNGGIQGAQNASVQSGGNQNGLVVVPGIANQSGTGLGHIARNCTARPRRRDAAYLHTQVLIAQKEEAGIQLQAEEFDFMAAAGDPDGLAEVHLNDNCYDNEIFNMFTQQEQYTNLLEPIPKPQLMPQNDNHVTSVALSTVQSGGTVETSFAPNEETRAHQETVYHNLVDQVAQNDREDIGKLGEKGDIGFFIGYSANSVAYIVYNQRTKKIMETMNVMFDELSAMAFEQNSSRPGLQIAPRAILAAPVLQNLQAPTTSMSFQDYAPVPTNSSNTLVSSHNVDATSQQHAQQQRNLTPSPTTSVADNVLNAVFEGDLFVNPFGTPSTESIVSST